MRRIKIIHLIQSAGYGVSVYVESLIKELDQTHYEQIILGSDYYNKARFRDIFDKVITIPMTRNISFIKDILTVYRCYKIIHTEKPDIVYCHSAKGGIYGRLSCLGSKAKVIYNPHGWSFNMHCSKTLSLIYKCIELTLALITNKIILISKF